MTKFIQVRLRPNGKLYCYTVEGEISEGTKVEVDGLYGNPVQATVELVTDIRPPDISDQINLKPARRI